MGDHPRDDAADRRDQAADWRDFAADRRDEEGDRRDDIAEQRDHSADRRDQAAEQRDRAAEQVVAAQLEVELDPGNPLAVVREEAVVARRRASEDRRSGAGERAQAGLDRNTALADRGAGASERSLSERDRNTASADRGAASTDRDDASLDVLTGVHLRGPGLWELDRELARAKRTGQVLALAFIDVDRLKAINDARGHAAGDRMLVQVATALKENLRPYDLIIRFGGDEFICAIPGLGLAQAAERLALVQAAIGGATDGGSVSFGVAQWQPNDTRDGLIARADAALYRARQEAESRP